MAIDSNPPVTDTYFDCHLCGDCCSSWSIPIEAEKAKVLLTREWVQERLNETRREVVSVSAKTYRLPLSDENVCVFLGADRRCLIEVNEGLTLKPSECQKFPFASVRLPNGQTKHDTSAACKHIAEKLLLAFQPILPRSEDEQPCEDVESFPKRIHLNLFRTADWSKGSQHWAEALRTIFTNQDCSSEQAVQQAAQLIYNWSQGKNKAPRQTSIRFAFWFTNYFLRKPYGTWSWVSLLRGRQYDDPRLFGSPVDLHAIKTIPWTHSYDHHVNAFLYNLLNRKRMLARGASLTGLLAMAVVAGLLIRWYATVLASLRIEVSVDEPNQPVEIELDDVTRAIRLVERYYTGHQPRFLHWFCNHWRTELLLRLMLA